jgi:hypothetical protein
VIVGRLGLMVALCSAKSGRERFKPVLVMETGQNRLRSDPMSLRNVVTGRSCDGQCRLLRDARTKARVRAASIVMTHPLGQDRPHMPLIERNGVVETLATRCADQSLAERVRLGHADRCFQHAKTHRSQCVVNSGRKHRIAIVHDKPVRFFRLSGRSETAARSTRPSDVQ